MDADSAVSAGQRRIELQSPGDLSYLIANVRSAAAARLDEAFPHVEGHEGGDELRDHIEALVNEYINKTFTLAAPNLTINGLPVSPEPFVANPSSTESSATGNSSDPVYEPFDARKRRRVADLITQEEKLLEEVAALKRSVPAKAAAEHAAALDDALARDQRQFEERTEGIGARVAAGGGDEGATTLDVGVMERQEGVEGRWRSAVEGLARLKSDMPAVVAKMERARIAGEYVVTEGR